MATLQSRFNTSNFLSLANVKTYYVQWQNPYLSIPAIKCAITFNIKKLSLSRDFGFLPDSVIRKLKECVEMGGKRL